MTVTTAPSVADEWAGILDAGETILWQGRPSSRLRLEFTSPMQPLFFLFFTGFSVFWMVMAAQAGGIFWTFGLLFFFVGAWSLVGQHFWAAFVRGRTFYTLTDRRAMIATEVFGRRSLKSYPVGPTTTIDFRDGTPGSIFFATETTTDGEGSVSTTKAGFEMIEDARSVFSLMRGIEGNK